ncbi:MAG: acyl-CoA reductase [Bacteroidetes bacterium]|nr:acyl-CoA reductase [Bacteroidota bacterium]
MTLDNRIKAFVALGAFLQQFSMQKKRHENAMNVNFYDDFDQLIKTVHIHNPWFTEDNVRNSVGAIAGNLNQEMLVNWISGYIKDLKDNKKPQRVAVVMAGNIPLVGFHDMLCVLISGNKFVGKLSSEDKFLLPFIAKVLIAIEPELANYIEFTEGQLKNMDAVIATGSNNTARYFDYYFGKYPNIIRKNRNSVAVLTGTETVNDLRLLGKDVFQYFGLGCRNVSKLFVPEGYNFNTFYESIFEYQNIINNNKYGNNYDYNRTVYLMSSHSSLLDNNFLLLKEDNSYSSPIGVLFYEFYSDIEILNECLEKDKEQLQCIVSNSANIKNALPFGQAQCPNLNDYADGVDTMRFLIGL